MSPNDRLAELLSDQLWRLNNLYWIEDKDGQLVRFKMNAAQMAFYRDMHNRNAILKARQLGMSTFVAIYMLDRCLFNPYQKCGIVDRTEPEAEKKIAKIALAWEMLDRVDEDAEDKELAQAIAKLGAKLKETLGTVKPNGELWPEVCNKTEIVFDNGSTIWGGVSFRGGTVQVLHISELGITANKDPLKAEEIKEGSFNAVGKNSILISESTHKGGRAGVHYEIIEAAMGNCGRTNLSPKAWRFHFYPWWQQDEYELDPSTVDVDAEILEYFDELKIKNGIDLVQKFGPQKAERKIAWYAETKREQKNAMRTEYPSHADEALDVASEGAIWGAELTKAKIEGRFKPITGEPSAPLWSFWDIGMADETVFWLIQPWMGGREFLVHRWFARNNKRFGFFYNQLKVFERELGVVCDKFFLPHDAFHRSKDSGLTYADEMVKHGVPRDAIKRVPKSADIWLGHDQTAELIDRCIFDERTDEPYRVGDKTMPGGFTRLLNYRSKVELDGSVTKRKPVEDLCIHTADAFRMFGEAHNNRMLTKWKLKEEQQERRNRPNKARTDGRRKAARTRRSALR